MKSPKASISKRAQKHDFEGNWSTIVDPLENVLIVTRRWAESDLRWWKLPMKGCLNVSVLLALIAVTMGERVPGSLEAGYRGLSGQSYPQET